MLIRKTKYKLLVQMKINSRDESIKFNLSIISAYLQHNLIKL
jgi:hypothetical protein